MSKVKDIVAAVGRSRIRDTLGVTEPSISRAIALGHFPANWYPAIRDLAAQNGVYVPEELFNWKIPNNSDNHTAA